MPKQPSPSVRVVAVDDDPVFLSLVDHILEDEADITLVGTATGVADGLDVTLEQRPDVVLMDVSLRDGDGVEATRLIRTADPSVQVIGLTGLDDVETVRDLVAAGAAGYIVKGGTLVELTGAIRATARGEAAISPGVTRAVLADLASMYQREHRRAVDLEMGVRHAVEALAAAIEARDEGTGAHSRGVPELAASVLQTIDPQAATDPTVFYGYLLHDVGKIGVPDAVLLKPGPLEPSEWERMREHPLHGARIVERIPPLMGTLAVDIVRHHHERWDGLGYPDGLSKQEIPSACRAFGVVDAYDAMTTDRPYRRAMSYARATDELRRNRGTQFDPDAVDALLELLDGEGTVSMTSA